MTVPEFVVYSRPGCHLCEILIEELLPLLRGAATVSVRNIDDDPALVESYGLRIPVVVLGDREICQFELDRAAVIDALDS